MEADKRKLIKFSNYSLCVTLPKWVVKSLNWKKGDVVNMDVDAVVGKIIITKGKSKSIYNSKENKINKTDNLRW